MKIPERLVGFVKYENIDMAFEFDSVRFIVNLYPPKDQWEHFASPAYIFGSHKHALSEHQWIPERRLEGVSSSGYRTIFSIKGDPTIFAGFLSFHAYWYFIRSNDDESGELFHGFSVMGKAVDSFYSPRIALEQSYEFGEHGISKISVTSKDNSASTCGSYVFKDTVSATMEIVALSSASSGDHEHPIFAHSKYITTFSELVTVDDIVEAFRYLLHFFRYITCRNNVVFEKIDLFTLNEKDKREYNGLLVFPPRTSEDLNVDAQSHLIIYQDLGEKVSCLFQDIKAQIISLQHNCDTFDARRSYPSSRVIMLLAAFERLYGSLYGKDTERSELYTETKDQVVALIKSYEEKCQGKRKQHVKDLRKFVANRDSSYSTNVIYALKTCSSIMKPFVLRKYRGSYFEIIEELGRRVGELRNGVAHCKLDFSLEAVHLCDLLVVEELLYAMELKHIGLTMYQCQTAINRLFKEHLFLPKPQDEVQADSLLAD